MNTDPHCGLSSQRKPEFFCQYRKFIYIQSHQPVYWCAAKTFRKKINNPRGEYDFPSALILKMQSVFPLLLYTIILCRKLSDIEAANRYSARKLRQGAITNKIWFAERGVICSLRRFCFFNWKKMLSFGTKNTYCIQAK